MQPDGERRETRGLPANGNGRPTRSGRGGGGGRERFLGVLERTLLPALGGMTVGDWFRLLWDNGFDVDPPYWPRAVLTTLSSVRNSFYRLVENRSFDPVLAAVEVRPPVFVLGHYRSGTTYLHDLLAVDPRFAFPNFAQVVFPHTFLSTGPANTRLMNTLAPSRRPQDQVRRTAEVPHEDEVALFVATACSPYMGLVFPRRQEHYERYLTLRGVPAGDLARWKAALVWFLKKLTVKYGRPLLLKSPPHTCRIRLLLELFPEARFVHIRRDPYRVFQSTRRGEERAAPAFSLQRVHDRDLDGLVLRRYQVMYDAFFEERGLIPEGRFHEVGFEDLECDPLGQVRTLYERLQLPGFEAVRPALEGYVASLGGYRKNEFPPLPDSLRRRVARAWRRSFEEWGYPA